MKIKNLSEIVLPDLPVKGKGIYWDDLPLGLYAHEPLLSEAHEMEKIAFPFPKDEMENLCILNPWHGCNVFGWRYSFGHINGCSLEKEHQLRRQYYRKMGYQREELKRQYKAIEVDFCNEVLRPVQNDYLKNVQKKFLSYDIIASLLALGIEPIKFWYAMLWLMDFVNDRTNDILKYKKAPLQDFSDLLEQLKPLCKVLEKQKRLEEELSQQKQLDEDSLLALSKTKKSYLTYKVELTLKVGEHKKIKVTTVDTLRILGKMIDEYLNRYKKVENTMEYIELNNCPCEYEDTSSDIIFDWKEKRENASYLMKIYLFKKYMGKYLEKIKGKGHLCVTDIIEDAPKEYANIKVSINKELLISRLACVIGFVADEKKYWNDRKAISFVLRKFKPTLVIANFYEYF